MDKLLFVQDIMARYRCSAPTARKRMRQMIHMEKPLAVTEWAVATWENGKTKEPKGKKKTAPRPQKIVKMDDWHIPRRRA